MSVSDLKCVDSNCECYEICKKHAFCAGIFVIFAKFAVLTCQMVSTAKFTTIENINRIEIRKWNQDIKKDHRNLGILRGLQKFSMDVDKI